MLNIFYGDMPDAVYNTASYFKFDFEDSWITDPFVKNMILDIDQSVVIDSGVIDSPVLGKIPPVGLSGGVKTLILVKFNREKVFNASTCGDNCARWLLEIAREEDRTINLRHLMHFGTQPFEIRILNTDQIVHSMKELAPVVDMIQEYSSHPSGSPAELICDKTCFVLAGPLWREQLSGMRDSIVFIDEENEFVRSDDFAREIQKTDNYYVIISRESLPSLPYSVDEIYGIRTSGKYGTLRQS